MRWYRVDDFDTWESQDETSQDVELRRMVDLLEDDARHLVERTFFGGAPLAHAAAEIDMTRARAEGVLNRALEQLKEWLAEGAPEGDPDRPAMQVSEPELAICGADSKWGPCQQPVAGDEDLCAAHLEWLERPVDPDPEYERAVVLGEKEPVQARFTRSEMDAVVWGRYRGDGRRLDAYVSFDPLEVEL